uniref:Uncharacterized protein n=1 Tax=Eutreptiella gymnastica TaxID=73025 RepID=A0A7S1NGH1_9EUGL
MRAEENRGRLLQNRTRDPLKKEVPKKTISGHTEGIGPGGKRFGVIWYQKEQKVCRAQQLAPHRAEARKPTVGLKTCNPRNNNLFSGHVKQLERTWGGST